MTSDTDRHGEDGPTDINGMLDLMQAATEDKDKVSLDDLVKIIGKRSFGPLILLAGLIVVVPVIGDVPGFTTAMSILVLMSLVQLVLHRDHVWLPRWLLNRTLSTRKLCKGINWLRKPARFIDRFLKPRLTLFVKGIGVYGILFTCLVLMTVIPALEIIPFTAWSAGVVWVAFGLALISRDGLLSLFGMLVALGILGTVAYSLLL